MIILIEVILAVVYLVNGLTVALLLAAADVREGRRSDILEMLVCVLAWPAVLWRAASEGP